MSSLGLIFPILTNYEGDLPNIVVPLCTAYPFSLSGPQVNFKFPHPSKWPKGRELQGAQTTRKPKRAGQGLCGSEDLTREPSKMRASCSPTLRAKLPGSGREGDVLSLSLHFAPGSQMSVRDLCCASKQAATRSHVGEGGCHLSKRVFSWTPTGVGPALEEDGLVAGPAELPG